MRKRARARGIKQLAVLYSTEEPSVELPPAQDGEHPTVGSVSFVPPVAGMMLAGHVLRELGGF